MMAAEIIETVSSAGGQLWLEGDEVHARLPKTLLALVEDIRRYKSEIMILLREPAERGMADHDPLAWAEEFHRWTLDRCVWGSRYFMGVGALHRDFCDWAIAHETVPCNHRLFERLLREMGFLIANGLVSGLGLREGLEAA